MPFLFFRWREQLEPEVARAWESYTRSYAEQMNADLASAVPLLDCYEGRVFLIGGVPDGYFLVMELPPEALLDAGSC